MAMGNKSSYAVAFALVIDAIGIVRSQEFCSCSPTKFEFVLKLSQTCETNDIAKRIGTPTNEGIKTSQCLTAEVEGVPGAIVNKASDPIINVQKITFLEFDPDGERTAINNDYNTGPYYDGQVLNFESVSLLLNTSIPLEDQKQYHPGGASLIMYAQTASGNIIRNRMWWTYDLTSCSRDTNPVQVGDNIGWMNVSDVDCSWPEFCTRATGCTNSPTKNPLKLRLQEKVHPLQKEANHQKHQLQYLHFQHFRRSQHFHRNQRPRPLYRHRHQCRHQHQRTQAMNLVYSMAKSNMSRSKPHSMSMVDLPDRREGSPNPNKYWLTSRIKEATIVGNLHKAGKTQQATSPSFAPAWELMAMFIFAAALVGWTFRRELFPLSEEARALHEGVAGEIQDASNDEEAIEANEGEEEEAEEEEEEEEQGQEIQEEVATSEDTEYIGDVVFNRTLQLINSSFDNGEAGGGSVGFLEDETDELVDDDASSEQQSPTQYTL